MSAINQVGDNAEKLIDLLDSIGYYFYFEENLEKYLDKKSLLASIPTNGTINVLCRSKI